MTPVELIVKLATYRGECMRFCAYCPDDFNTAEVKECVEKLVKDHYSLEKENEELLRDITALQSAYRKETGHDYKFT
jgi:hypothetical protein